MGGLSNRSIMKSFVFVCLFAAASAAPAADADADPALLYSAFPHTYTYGAVPAVHTAVVKNVVSTPAKVEVKSVATPVTYNVHTPVVHHPVVPTADADADALYGYYGYARPYAYTYGHPYAYRSAYTYGGAYRPYGYYW